MTIETAAYLEALAKIGEIVAKDEPLLMTRATI